MHFMAVWNICEDILSDWLYNRTEVHAAGDAGHLKIHSFQHTIFLWVDVGENFECRAKSDIMTLVIRFGLAPMARACPTAHHTVLGFTIPISTPKIYSTPMPEGIIITRYVQNLVPFIERNAVPSAGSKLNCSRMWETGEEILGFD